MQICLGTSRIGPVQELDDRAGLGRGSDILETHLAGELRYRFFVGREDVCMHQADGKRFEALVPQVLELPSHRVGVWPLEYANELTAWRSYDARVLAAKVLVYGRRIEIVVFNRDPLVNLDGMGMQGLGFSDMEVEELRA